MKYASIISILFGSLFYFSQAYAATMRCDGGLISTGTSSFEVLKKCGEPADRMVVEPTIQPDGNPPRGSVTVEKWVYGPENGAHSFLRFIDGRLVKIETRRL